LLTGFPDPPRRDGSYYSRLPFNKQKFLFPFFSLACIPFPSSSPRHSSSNTNTFPAEIIGKFRCLPPSTPTPKSAAPLKQPPLKGPLARGSPVTILPPWVDGVDLLSGRTRGDYAPPWPRLLPSKERTKNLPHTVPMSPGGPAFFNERLSFRSLFLRDPYNFQNLQTS